MAPTQRRRSPSPENEPNNGTTTQNDELAHLQLANPDKTCRHLFLQSLMARRTVPFEVVRQLYKDCVNLCKVETPEPLDNFLASLEPGLTICGLELKSTRDQETGRGMYILINSLQDGPAKIATEYKAEEIAFFKLIVEKIMLAPDMAYCCTQVEAIKLAKAPITRVVAIQLIKSFLAKGWLSLHPTGRLILSPRSLVELSPYIKETFAHEDEEEDGEDIDPRDRTIVDCNFCLQIVTSGYACPNVSCKVRLHTFCTAQRLGSNGLCPDRLSDDPNPCQQNWYKDPQTGKFVGDPVGVNAVVRGGGGAPTSQMSEEEEEEDVRGASANKKGKKQGGAKGRGSATKGKGKGKKRGGDDDDEEEEEDEDMLDDDDEEEDSDAVPTQSSTRKSSRTTSRRKQAVQEDSDEEMED